ncbi:hypothetical protein J5N97_009737 [Dioscorea zingiberensis]|uniref:Alpha/beta hydrolase fold-3 domain-containing protein n=1 Tax=Dioscorea zingiberensis TaxID=325984 RepID=A0A9D5HMZ3_9LILI|nr:hypothetical protein J5N97_009737 [Dioscorea zingiberensis]
MDSDDGVDIQIFDFLRVHRSGRVERLRGTEVVPAGDDAVTGVSSKDILIDTETGVSARIYIPNLHNLHYDEPAKLPVLVYFHGGGFCIQTAFSPTYHTYLNSLSSEAKIIIVSIDYRLAPEHPLPVAYNDCWEALQWVASHSNAAGPEPWLAKFSDLGRLFLAGDSAGANIAHHMGMRARAENLKKGLKIKGIVLIHPYFWGSEPVGEENVGEELRRRLDELWMFLCPESDGVDDPRINPIAKGAPKMDGMACEKLMVCVAEKDAMSSRGRVYYERLKEMWGGVVELVVSEGMDHVFHLEEPSSGKAVEMMTKVVAFLCS